MSQTEKNIKYGVHQITAYNIKTGMPYGTAKVIGEASLSLSGSLNKLTGGSSPFPYKAVAGNIESEVSLKLKEYPTFISELFMGVKPTQTSTASTGEVVGLANVFGELIKADTGIASIGVKAGSEADLKFGHYVAKAVSATTVHIYLATDIDKSRGANVTFYDDQQRVTDTPLTVAMGAGTDIPNLGLEITGGSGTIAMNEGDTASFKVNPPHDEKIVTEVGGSLVFPEFGLLIYGERLGETQLNELEIYNCIGIGGNLGFAEKAYSEQELKCSAFIDSQGRIYKETLIR